MKIVALCLALTLSACSLSQGVVLSGVGDYATTRMAINSGKGSEANSLMGQGALRQGLIKSLGIGAVLGSASLVEHKGHRTLARVIKGAAIVAWSAAAFSNGNVIHSARARSGR